MSNKILIGAFLAVFAVSAMAMHEVRTYTKKDGTAVQEHKSMNPGESKDTGMSYHDDELVTRE